MSSHDAAQLRNRFQAVSRLVFGREGQLGVVFRCVNIHHRDVTAGRFGNESLFSKQC